MGWQVTGLRGYQVTGLTAGRRVIRGVTLYGQGWTCPKIPAEWHRRDRAGPVRLDSLAGIT
jgi:hypothetical protein